MRNTTNYLVVRKDRPLCFMRTNSFFHIPIYEIEENFENYNFYKLNGGETLKKIFFFHLIWHCVKYFSFGFLDDYHDD